MDNRLIHRNGRYLSFLLRLWQESDDNLAPQEPPQWRASLEEPKTSERLWFETLVDLFAFIENKTRSNALNIKESGEENAQP